MKFGALDPKSGVVSFGHPGRNGPFKKADFHLRIVKIRYYEVSPNCMPFMVCLNPWSLLFLERTFATGLGWLHVILGCTLFFIFWGALNDCNDYSRMFVSSIMDIN